MIMKDLKLHERFAIIALNGLEVETMTTAKKLALRGIKAAELLENWLDAEDSEKLPQREFFKITSLSVRKLRQIERETVDALKKNSLIETIPSIVNCDMYYVTSGVKVSEYLCRGEEFTRQTEYIRSELLENGEISTEVIFLWWLLRESSCFYDMFSPLEMDIVSQRLNELYLKSGLSRSLFNLKIQRKTEQLYAKYLKKKREIFSTALGTGFLFLVPFFERKQSVFIEAEEWFSNKDKRIACVLDRFSQCGHSVMVVRTGDIPIIKVDNIYYECIPAQVVVKFPIQGVRLRRYVLT